MADKLLARGGMLAISEPLELFFAHIGPFHEQEMARRDVQKREAQPDYEILQLQVPAQ